MAVRLYSRSTNWEWRHKCSMHRFNPFGVHSDTVQLMYGHTAYCKYLELAIYVVIHFVWESIGNGCKPVHRLYEAELTSQMFHSLLWSIWLPFESCTVDLLTYSLFYIFWISYIWAHSFCMGENWTIAVNLHIDCTKLNLYQKGSLHWFGPFGCHLHPVQLNYGRTAYFIYFELAMYGPIYFVW